MPAKQRGAAPASVPERVDLWMRELKHPLAGVVEALRRSILSVHADIGEEVKWNAPAFFYTGPMGPFDPKNYKRHIAVVNVQRKDCVRLVFLQGARIGDASGLLEGDYADGRRLASFRDVPDVQTKEAALRYAVRRWIATVDCE